MKIGKADIVQPQYQGWRLFFLRNTDQGERGRFKYSNKFDGEAETLQDFLYHTLYILFLVSPVDGNRILF